MRKIKNKKQTKTREPIRSGDVPATKAMLDETREELKHQTTSVKLELSAKIDAVAANLNRVEAKMESRIDTLAAAIHRIELELNSKIEKILAAVQRVGLLVEEQNARNKFVLDGYTSLNGRVEKLEKKTDESL